jgi:hypothetical protein
MNRHTISISIETFRKLQQLQITFQEKYGLDLSITQVIDFLIKQHGGVQNGNN